LKSKIKITNLIFNNNINNSKSSCGGISFTNDVYISVTNSSFINNQSKDNGGAMY